MRIIENGLVPVYETNTGEKIVYGKDLHKSLLVRTDFSTWVKRRLNECDAKEKIDYDLLPKIEEQISGTKHSIEYEIKLDTAKEMAMLERNEIGKQVRKYFIEVDNRHKQQEIDRQELSPQTQALIALTESIARTELQQKRITERQNKLEERVDQQAETIQTVKETFTKGASEQETTQWVNHCITKIAESPNFTFAFGNRYAAARNESYQRLTTKAGCCLDQKVRNAIARAEEKGSTQAQKNNINKLTVIMADKRLKEIYVGVIKEMMIAYCVEVSAKKEMGNQSIILH